MKTLYKFHFDCGRQGTLNGVFVADSKKVEEAIGKRVYFGEVLGKHSEVYGTLDDDEVTAVTSDPDFVSKFQDLELETGFNPLDYLSE